MCLEPGKTKVGNCMLGSLGIGMDILSLCLVQRLVFASHLPVTGSFSVGSRWDGMKREVMGDGMRERLEGVVRRMRGMGKCDGEVKGCEQYIWHGFCSYGSFSLHLDLLVRCCDVELEGS